MISIKALLLMLCLLALISAASFGIASAIAELRTKQPKYAVYMKLSALLIGIAGVLAALIATI